MNASIHTAKAEREIAVPTAGSRLRNYLGGRRGWILLALVVVSAALYLNWGWLAAIGVAPLLLALAPCAAMCALGLCMNKSVGKSCSKSSSDETPAAKNATPAAVRRD
jgi:hypothetical protein